jgi:neutral ceramidase
VSPNTLGPKCPDGSSCDNPKSECPGRDMKDCIARGPGYPSDFKSTEIIGENQVRMCCDRVGCSTDAAAVQADFAMKLFDAATLDVTGTVDFRHMHVNMTAVQVDPQYTGGVEGAHTCRAAMGYRCAVDSERCATAGALMGATAALPPARQTAPVSSTSGRATTPPATRSGTG